jgi:hypothetical protein
LVILAFVDDIKTSVIAIDDVNLDRTKPCEGGYAGCSFDGDSGFCGLRQISPTGVRPKNWLLTSGQWVSIVGLPGPGLDHTTGTDQGKLLKITHKNEYIIKTYKRSNC